MNCQDTCCKDCAKQFDCPCPDKTCGIVGNQPCLQPDGKACEFFDSKDGEK